jgi:hypothetical protein
VLLHEPAPLAVKDQWRQLYEMRLERVVDEFLSLCEVAHVMPQQHAFLFTNDILYVGEGEHVAGRVHLR